MRHWRPLLVMCVLLGTLGGCPQLTVQRNPYLAFTEEFVGGSQQEVAQSGPAGVGSAAAGSFRQSLALSFRNAHNAASLETSFAAWIEIGSVSTSSQQNALLDGGYIQLTEEVRLGSAYTLPAGTFVYGGAGTAGTTKVTLPVAQGADDATQDGAQGGGTSTTTVTPTSISFDLITPDRILVYSQPPVSCDSVAFTYHDLVTGEILEGPSTGAGGYKTLAQVDAYDCYPFEPGLLFNIEGGQADANRFREGQAVTITFSRFPSAGAFALVTIGETAVEEQQAMQ